MLNLIVQMPGEPVVEETRLHVAGCGRHGDKPVLFLVHIYVHWNVGHLGNKRKPETLQEPVQRRHLGVI